VTARNGHASKDLNGTLWLIAAFIVSFIAVGVPYFLAPYHQTDFTDLFGPGTLVLVLAAAASVRLARAPVWLAVPTMASVMPAVVLLRIIVDVAMDPTTHNLWPLELAIAAPLGLMVGGGAAVVGALLGRGKA
jgi:hypothetical protein